MKMKFDTFIRDQSWDIGCISDTIIVDHIIGNYSEKSFS
jgi:hypothetical protein